MGQLSPWDSRGRGASLICAPDEASSPLGGARRSATLGDCRVLGRSHFSQGTSVSPNCVGYRVGSAGKDVPSMRPPPCRCLGQ